MHLVKLLKERARRKKAREAEPEKPLIALTEEEKDKIWDGGRGFRTSSRPIYITQRDDWED